MTARWPRLGFGPWLAIIAAAGLAARIAYVAVIGTGLTLGFDAQWYGLQGGLIDSGLGYIDPDAFYQRFLGEPTATFPPLWPIVVAGANRLGLATTTHLQLVGAVVGSATVVLAGLLGRRVAGPRVGLVTALIVAGSPMLIAADGSVMSESLYVALVTAVMVLSYRALAAPSVLRFGLVGLMLGLAALTRADALFLAPILAGALGWRVTSGSPARRLALAATTLAVTVGVLTPWVVYSSTRMGSTVLVSTNSGGMLQGANCRSTYYGPLLGAWDPTCGRPRQQSESELAWASEARGRALDYARSQPARLPLVATARVLRTWGLWAPADQARLEAVETRDEGWQIFGWGYHMVVLGLAVPGTVILVRRRAELTPMAALAVAVVVTAALSNGNQRFRLAIDPVLAVLAATTILAALRRFRPGPPTAGDEPEGRSADLANAPVP